HLAPRSSRRAVAVAGLALIIVGIVAITLVLNPAVPVLLAPVAWGVAGLGMGLAFSTNALVVLESATPGQEGTASAAMQIANILGSALGTGIGGVLIGSASAANGALQAGIVSQALLMIAMAGLAVLTALRLPGAPTKRDA